MFGLVRITLFMVGVLSIGVATVLNLPGTPLDERVTWGAFRDDGRSLDVPDGFRVIDPFRIDTRYEGMVWSHFAPPPEAKVALLQSREESIELFVYLSPAGGFETLVEAALNGRTDVPGSKRLPPRVVKTRDGTEIEIHVVQKDDPVHDEGDLTLLLGVTTVGDSLLVVNGGGRAAVLPDPAPLIRVIESLDLGSR